MPFLNPFDLTPTSNIAAQLRDIQARDRTARSLVNLGRCVTSRRPYRIMTINDIERAVLDIELFERFIFFCSRKADSTNFSETEMSLFLVKLSTVTDTDIPETEREKVFSRLSDQILRLVRYESREDVDITQEWREDSEKNKTEDNTWL